jgi:hypothetical protein
MVPTKIISERGEVAFEKFCTEHGLVRVPIRSNLNNYLAAQRYVKPAWTPQEFSGKSDVACPDGCGMCARHEQHLCMPIVEITGRCDLACPICLVDAGHTRDMTPDEFSHLLDSLIRAERQIDVLNISGGEPLLHPQLLQLIDMALNRPGIIRVSVSTNGLRLLKDAHLARELRARNVVVSLQCDGFSEHAYTRLRGRALLDEKRRILELLGELGVTTSLAMTVAASVNDDQFRPMLDYLFNHEHVVSLMLQPMAFVGRGAAVSIPKRMTLPDVVVALGAARHPSVRAEDFLPLPCSHPLCFSLAFYLMLKDGNAASVNRLIHASTMLDALANRTIFGLDADEHARLKEMIYELWSGPAGAAPDAPAVMKVLSEILRELSSNCSCFDPRKAFAQSERRMKSIFIHAFQDADTFDLARVRKCCNAYPQPDGSLIPVCVNNVLRRRNVCV